MNSKKRCDGTSLGKLGPDIDESYRRLLTEPEKQIIKTEWVTIHLIDGQEKVSIDVQVDEKMTAEEMLILIAKKCKKYLDKNTRLNYIQFYTDTHKGAV